MMTHRSKLFKFFLVGIIIAGIGACEKDKIEVKEYGKLSGLVLDAQTNIPIPTANISTNPASTTVLTDSEGKFFLDEVPSGDVVINAQKDKYITGSVKVAVYPNETTDVIIMLEPSDPSQSVVKFSDPDPPNQAVDQFRTLTLSWRVMDNAGYDSLRFDVLLFESPGMEHKVVASDIKDTSAIVDFLFYGKTYYWQVVAKVEDTEVNRSVVWTFSTLPFPDVPFFYAKEVDGSYEIFNSDSISSDTAFYDPIVQLTDFPSFIEWCPQLNPDLNLIAFTSNMEFDPQIYTIKRDGSELTKITTLPNVGYHNQGIGYCWAPDGEKILYSYYDKLYRINKNGTGLYQIATAPVNRNFRECDWNGYTGKIVVQTMGQLIYESEIYIMNEDGSDMTMLIEDRPGRVESPSLSIDGSHLLFTHDIDGFNAMDGRQLNAHIFSMSVDAQDTLDLSSLKPAGTNDLQPRYSPDGAFIIFINVNNTGLGPKDIWVMNYEGTGRVMIIEEAEMPFWGAID